MLCKQKISYFQVIRKFSPYNLTEVIFQLSAPYRTRMFTRKRKNQFIYYIHFEITGHPCNLIGFQQ